MANDNGLKILGGLIVGTAIGAVVGLLTAPDSGKKTRKKLDKETKRLSNDLSKTVNETIEALKASYNDILANAANSSKETINSTKKKIEVHSQS